MVKTRICGNRKKMEQGPRVCVCVSKKKKKRVGSESFVYF
jgi:hypothetical protein